MLNKRLKEIRKEKSLTQNQVAEYLGITRANYTGYETGARKPPHDKIIKLSEFFDVSADYLLGITNIKTSLKNLESNKELSSIIYNQEINEAFEDYSSWSNEDKKELLSYLKAKKLARKNNK